MESTFSSSVMASAEVCVRRLRCSKDLLDRCSYPLIHHSSRDQWRLSRLSLDVRTCDRRDAPCPAATVVRSLRARIETVAHDLLTEWSDKRWQRCGRWAARRIRSFRIQQHSLYHAINLVQGPVSPVIFRDTLEHTLKIVLRPLSCNNCLIRGGSGVRKIGSESD